MPASPRRVIEFRETTNKVVSILSERKVAVTQEGVDAFVAWDAEGNIIKVNLPYIPDTASDEMLDALRGFLDHECAHILHTAPQDLPEFTHPKHDKIKALSAMSNLIEDTRIEREMQKRFPGSANNLENVFNFVSKDMLEPQLAKMKASGDTSQAFKFLVMPLIRAWSNQRAAHEMMNRVGGYDLIPDQIKQLEPFKSRIPLLSSTAETTALALEIIEALQNPPEQQDQQGDGDADKQDTEEDSQGSAKADKGSNPERAKGKGKKDRKGSKKDDKKEPGPSTLDQVEAAKDIDGAVSEALTQKLKQEIDHSTYLPFTTDYDQTVPVTANPGCEGQVDAEIVRTDSRVRSIVGQMQSHMRRLFAQQDVSVNYGGQRSGRLQASALHRLASKDDRVFFRREEHQATDTAITLLIDLSGSMLGGGSGGTKLKVACETAYALAQTLERLGLQHEIVGFTTEDNLPSDARERAEEQAKKLKRQFSRYTSINLFVFKSFAERINSKVRRAIVGTGMTKSNDYSMSDVTNVKPCENVDGESLMMAARRLLKRREGRKVMIVLSDGQPSADGPRGQLQKHLRDTVVAVERMGVETIGIGIQDDSVEDYYPKNVVCNAVEDLPGVVMGQLRKILLNR